MIPLLRRQDTLMALPAPDSTEDGDLTASEADINDYVRWGHITSPNPRSVANPWTARMIVPRTLSTRRSTRQVMRYPPRKHDADLLQLWATSGSATAGRLPAVDSILWSISPQSRTVRRELTQVCPTNGTWFFHKPQGENNIGKKGLACEDGFVNRSLPRKEASTMRHSSPTSAVQALL
jgi:hypothetical protein